ncbi:hypothetical protein SAMN04487926_12248 [Paraburkholderia steynii]|uniref:Uncharacterized protein n=1 Tax=Paraburkholderia steynii TaxID=1245441 RepID=A0A7Z7FLY2_9BURK|nr:hypothetical protein SAMN04487926_12248 [Paraburkholderia steynii]
MEETIISINPCITEARACLAPATPHDSHWAAKNPHVMFWVRNIVGSGYQRRIETDPKETVAFLESGHSNKPKRKCDTATESRSAQERRGSEY